ncbi:MAG: family 43 glycosylhydrolase [Deinococcota bacterium]
MQRIVIFLTLMLMISCGSADPEQPNTPQPQPPSNEPPSSTPSFAALLNAPNPPFEVHDPSNIVEMAPGVYSFFASSNPDWDYQLRQFTLDMNQAMPSWQEQGFWSTQDELPEFLEWHVPWMEQYGYDGTFQIEHRELATIAPSLLDAQTVYFNMRNTAGYEWAAERDEEPAMFHAMYKANASGTYPNQTWSVDPIPVYYSDETTFGRGGPRAVDTQVWRDDDGQLYMTFGSWDPANRNVIAIADMDETTGRIEGFTASAPGYYNASSPAFHPVATFGEAAQSFKHGDYYYLFLNLGGCCSGLDSTYTIVVGRSSNLYGPYTDDLGRAFMDVYPETADTDYVTRFPGKLLLQTEGDVIGPGHTGIYTHSDGRVLMSFHYYDGRDNGTPKLATRELAFDAEGWPYVVRDVSTE